MYLFVDRIEAGEKLAAMLLDDPLVRKAARAELLVLSIPRGGVVVGAAIAQALACAHDVVVTKKIGFPGQAEAAMGAMAEDGTVVLNPLIPRWQWLEDAYLKHEIEDTKAKIEAYIEKFRQGRTLDLQAKTVIVVDDGIATGETMKAAVRWIASRDQSHRPKQVLVAVPVCAPSAAKDFEQLVDKLVCLAVPENFWAVGQFYQEFRQISDEEVRAYLCPSRPPSSGRQSEPMPTAKVKEREH